MAVGFSWTKGDIDARAGAIARDLVMVMRSILTFKNWLDTQVDADLIALGYTAGEVTTLRGSLADAAQLAAVCRGSATVAVAKDFTAFLSRMAGPGQIG